MKNFIVSLLFFLSGCVSIPTHEKAMRDSFIQGLERARSIAVSQDCIDAAYLISGRIKVEEMRK